MNLALSFGTSTMFMLEYIRYFRIAPVGFVIDDFLNGFIDKKKEYGPVILSHIY